MIEIIIFIFGSMVGSFLNVCIYRLPEGLSVAVPARSFCPQCKKQIPWFYNIPLISWLMLRGRCKFCSAKIPFRYFFVELVTAALFVYLWRFSGGVPVLFAVRAVFLSMLFVIVVTDFEAKIIPDAVTFPGMILGLLCSLLPFSAFPQEIWYYRLLYSALGLAAGYGILFGTALIANFVFRKESMGGGDLKLLAMMGAFIGAGKIFYVFMLAPFIALPFALWYRFAKKDEQIPFGPFLALWGAAFFLYGDFFTPFLDKIYGVN